MARDRRALESFLAFWLDGGVDTLFAPSPRDRRRPQTPSRLASRVSPLPAMAAADAPAPPSQPVFDETIGQARRLAGAADDLAGLAAAIAAFEGCGLKRLGAKQAVFFRGAPDAPVLVIGEGPGAEEDAQGSPFVGRAGRLLDRMLAAAGLESRVFITNTVFWRPPGNRPPTVAEQAVCAPFLERAIELVRPRLLLLAGAAASQSMLGQKGGILSIRGKWRDWVASTGDFRLPALPTLHPAFLLRTPAAKKMAWTDLLTLVARLEEVESID